MTQPTVPILSISDLNHYLDCPYAAVWKHTHKLWTPPSASMRLGTAIHAYLESRLGGELPTPAMEDLDPDIGPDYLQHMVHLESWEPDFKVLATEEALGHNFGPFVLVGRLDARVEDAEGEWSFQVKTMGKGKNPATVLARTRLSHHEVAYHMLAHMAGHRLKGTILLMSRTLSQKDLKANVNPVSCTRLRRDYSEAEEIFWTDIYPPLRAFAQDIEYDQGNRQPNDPAIRRNWQSCINRYNQRCPLFDSCHGSGAVDTSGLVQMDDRYTDLPLATYEPSPGWPAPASQPAPHAVDAGPQAAS